MPASASKVGEIIGIGSMIVSKALDLSLDPTLSQLEDCCLSSGPECTENRFLMSARFLRTQPDSHILALKVPSNVTRGSGGGSRLVRGSAPGWSAWDPVRWTRTPPATGPALAEEPPSAGDPGSEVLEEGRRKWARPWRQQSGSQVALSTTRRYTLLPC